MPTVEKENMPDSSLPVRQGWRVLRDRWDRWVAPTADNLPNRRVIAIPLAALAVFFIILVACGVTGSSTGIVHSQISTGSDPDLIAGEPQAIRSDEWFVQSSWVISQVEQSLPAWNKSFPGGMDATVQNDLPSADWSTAFRPHLLGFFFLPLDQAMAFKWWLPALGVVASVFMFTMSLLPRRPLTAMALGVGTLFAPFLQWWYLSLTLYPVLWAFVVMAGFVWCLKTRRRGVAWAWGAAAGYATPALAMGIYVPFMVPAVLVTAAFCLGALFSSTMGRPRLRERVKDVLPIVVGGVVGCAVMVLWILTRLGTIRAFLETVYPGERLERVGGADLTQLAQLFSGFLSYGLQRSQGAPFTVNASEASTFLLPGVFLLAALAWTAVSRYRALHRLDGPTIGLVVAAVIMLAFMFVPGWDALAHLLLLDRTTYTRVRIGFGILSVVVIVLLTRRLEDAPGEGWRPARSLAWVSAALAAASIVFVLLRGDALIGFTAWIGIGARRDVIIAAAAACALIIMVWLFARRRVFAGSVLFLVTSLVLTAGVNPVYRGVLDLRDTATVAEVQKLDAADPGAWVGINASLVPTMMLVESGVETYNGVQGTPSDEMWSAIDPTGASEDAWNRLATVSWLPGEGDPDPRNPFPDQIQLTFDSCAPFAQEHVAWVLSPVVLDQACVTEVETIPEGAAEMRIYRVESAR